MPSSFNEAVKSVHAVLRKAEVLRHLGFLACDREVRADSLALPAMVIRLAETIGAADGGSFGRLLPHNPW
jgi:hypothetical protein